MSSLDDAAADPAPRPDPAFDPRTWIWAVFTCLLALTVLKGLRMPNKWSVTHYLFTYDVGFIKRGLWGAMLQRVFGTATANYFVLAAVGLIVCAGIVALLVWLSRQLPDDVDRVPVLLVTAASPAIAFLAHLAGYLEQVGYLALLAAIALRRHPRGQAAVAIGSAALLPLVHEASILWVGSLLLLAILIGGGTSSPLRPRLRLAGIVALVGVCSTLAVIQWGRVSRAQMEALRDDRTAFFEMRPRQDAFQTLTIPLAESLADMRRRWAERATQLDMVFSLLVFAPAGAFLTVLALRRARALDGPRWWRRAAGALVMLAVGGPLVLHLVGWDLHRWNALAVLNAGIAALALFAAPVEARAAATRPTPRRTLALALVVCTWSVSADPVFFDAYGPDHPPFVYHVQFLIEAVKTGDRAIWLPRN